MKSTTKSIYAFITLCITILTFYAWNQKNTVLRSTPQCPMQLPAISESLPLVVVLMVRNEEDVMAKTLHPFMQAGVQGYLILDTGSTDETIIRTRKLFADYHIKHGYIVEQPFIDFAASRNYAMECAEHIFPNAGFFFMIDAEWATKNVDGLIQFCQLCRNEPIDALKILIHYKNTEYYVSRILKADKKIRFTSVVHEYAQVNTTIKLPKDIYVEWNDSEKGTEKSKLRWKKDIELLLKQHKTYPDDLRTIYYIAQTYNDLQDYENAIIWFKKRLEADGWVEERLIACSAIARIYDHLGNWPLAQLYYLQAYNLNPQRAESLIRLAQHYLRTENFATCFLFAQKAENIPYPTDAIQASPMDYFYTRYDVLSAAAWNIREYDAGEKAIKKALVHYPNDQHLLDNLKVFQTRKK